MGIAPLPLDRYGQRFSIRLHEPTGGYRDVVGHLKSPNSVINRHGVEVTFDPSQIAVWREIVQRPTAAGKGAPLTLRVFELDQICNATWPALETKEVDGWLLRAANGVTNRANSVLPLAASLFEQQGSSFQEKLNAATQFYSARNLPTIFHLALPTWKELFENLATAGGEVIIRANTMVADIMESKHEIPAGFELIKSSEVSQEWLDVHETVGVERIVAGCPSTFLTLRYGSNAVATVRLAINNGWSSITRVYVSSDFRGQGLGKLIVAAALQESLKQGVTKSVLQVEAQNSVAISMYESLGFNFHHEYVYLEMK